MENSLAEEKAQRRIDELLEDAVWSAVKKCVYMSGHEFNSREELVSFLSDAASEVFCEHGVYVDGVLSEEFDETLIEEQLELDYEDELAALGWNY